MLKINSKKYIKKEILDDIINDNNNESLKVNNIKKLYGSKVILDDLNLDIKENNLIAFIGPNGAGKSTLLSIIARLIERNGGEVLLNGIDVLSWKKEELSKKLSILRQNNNLNIKLTAFELISFGRYPYSKDKLNQDDIDIINEYMDFLKISHLKDSYIDEVSGGQLQLIYICMILVQDAKYILLDEPLNNLDMSYSRTIMKSLKELVLKKNKTIIIVIHDINFASFYADYIVLTKNGKIYKEGLTNDIITKETLKEVYDLDIDIIEKDGKKLCVYY